MQKFKTLKTPKPINLMRAAAIAPAALGCLCYFPCLQAGSLLTGGIKFLHFWPAALLTGAILAGRRDSRSLAATAALGGLALWTGLRLNPRLFEGCGPPSESIVFQTFIRCWLALIALVYASRRRADSKAKREPGRAAGRLVPLSALALIALTAFASLLKADPPVTDPTLFIVIMPALIILFVTPLWLAGRGRPPFDHILSFGLGLSFFMAVALWTAQEWPRDTSDLLIAALSLGAVLTLGALLIGCAGLALPKSKPAALGRPRLLLAGVWLFAALALAGLYRFSRLNLEAEAYGGPAKTMQAGYLKLEVPEDVNKKIIVSPRSAPPRQDTSFLTRWRTHIDWPELKLQLYDELPFDETTPRAAEILERGLDVDVAGQPAKLLVKNDRYELTAEACRGALHFVAEARPYGADKKSPAAPPELFLAKVAEVLTGYQWVGNGAETGPGFRTKYGLLNLGPEAALSLYAGFAQPYGNWHLQILQGPRQGGYFDESGSPLVLEMAETWNTLFFRDVHFAGFSRPLTVAGRAGRLGLRARDPLAVYAVAEDWRSSRRTKSLNGNWTPLEEEPDAGRQIIFDMGAGYWHKDDPPSYPEVLGVWEMLLSRAAWAENSGQ